MQSVRQIAEEIVAREGGFVNDPDDPGGATKYGVTIHTLRRLGLDLDRDGDVDVADVKRIDRKLAADIFVRHYFEGPRLSRLPKCVQPSVFDMYVNAGANAVKILQKLICDMGQSVAVDGIVGPQTIGAAEICAAAAPRHFADAYGIARRNYYYRLGDARSTMRKYCVRRDGGKGGWITRAEAFVTPRYHLTAAEHRKRVSAWA